MSLSSERLVEFIKGNPISVGCAVLSLGLLGAIYFRGDLVTKEAEQLEQKSAEAARLDRNLKNATQLKEHLDGIIAAGKEIEGRLINAENLPANNQYFYKLESETGVKLIGDPRQTSAKKDAKTAFVPTAFTVTVQGEYAQLITFLRHLENGTHYCRVLTANCTNNSSSVDQRSPQLTLTLNLELLGRP